MKKNYLLGFLSILAFCTSVLAQPQAGKKFSSGGSYIGGLVVDDESGDGLINVEVSVVDETGKSITSSDGRFSIYVVNQSLCRLRFKKSGYVEIGTKDVAINGNSFRKEFRMEKIISKSVSGRVVDTEGHAVEDVEITVVGAKPRIYRTDKDGIFQVFTPDITQIRINARKNGYKDQGVIFRSINPVLAISEEIVLEREIATPPPGRIIMVLEKGTQANVDRGPISGVVAYVNMQLSSTGQWGVSNDRGIIIVNADPGEKITLKKEGYLTLYNIPMPETSRWIVEMQPESWYEEKRFMQADHYMRHLINQIYKASKIPVGPGLPNPKFEQLLDSFQLGFKAIANFGYIANDSLDLVRRTQYFDTNGPFRILSEYINGHTLKEAAKWKGLRLLRDSLVQKYESEEHAILRITQTISTRDRDVTVYAKIPQLLREAEQSCRQLIFISVDLRDKVGLDIKDIIERNLQSFQKSMDNISQTIKLEIPEQPILVQRIENESNKLKKTLAELAKWAEGE